MFTLSAANFLEALKGLDAFRKGDPANKLAADAVFLCSTPGGLVLSALQSQTFLDCAVWLPASVSESATFSFLFSGLFSFAKATKGKGWIEWKDGKLISANGTIISLSAGPSLANHEQVPNPEGHDTSEIMATEGPTVGFNLAPFLTAAAFCSTDESKLVLTGAQFRHGSVGATDGYSLRELPALRPAYSKAETLPEDAWLPAWLVPVVAQFRKPAKLGDSLAFYFAAKRGRQAIRFLSDSGLIVACQFPERLSNFPDYSPLFPDNPPYSATVNLPAFIDAIKGAVEALKGSAERPRVRLSWDGAIGEVSLSAKLERQNGGSKFLPNLETYGHYESSLSATFQDFAADPRLAHDFYDLTERQQEAAKAKYEDCTSFMVDGHYLLRMAKSFACDGDRLAISWANSRSAIVMFGGVNGSRALLMPVQVRK
jgi:hypothetical protein